MAEGGGCLRVNAENDARGEFTARLLDCQVKPPKKKKVWGRGLVVVLNGRLALERREVNPMIHTERKRVEVNDGKWNKRKF